MFVSIKVELHMTLPCVITVAYSLRPVPRLSDMTDIASGSAANTCAKAVPGIAIISNASISNLIVKKILKWR